MSGQRPPDYGGPQGGGDLSGIQPTAENDKLLGALCYIVWFLVPIIILATDMKQSRFAKVHAYQGIVFAVVGFAFYIVYGIFTTVMSALIPFIWCVLWVGWFLPFALALYLAYKVFTQSTVEFPYLTDGTRSLFKDL